jgi:hypothetical protein
MQQGGCKGALWRACKRAGQRAGLALQRLRAVQYILGPTARQMVCAGGQAAIEVPSTFHHYIGMHLCNTCSQMASAQAPGTPTPNALLGVPVETPWLTRIEASLTNVAWHVLQKVGAQLKGRVQVVKIDSDKYTKLASRYSIQVGACTRLPLQRAARACTRLPEAPSASENVDSYNRAAMPATWPMQSHS